MIGKCIHNDFSSEMALKIIRISNSLSQTAINHPRYARSNNNIRSFLRNTKSGMKIVRLYL